VAGNEEFIYPSHVRCLWYSMRMKSIAQFTISQGEDGLFVAEGLDLPIVTQAETLDELTKNIREAVDLALEGEQLEEIHFSRDPSIMVSFELPRVHA
jgi:predicted RNase H-like HicB family nuclease